MSANLKLTDLQPHWLVDARDRRIGVSFLCPLCKGAKCTKPWQRVHVQFDTATDGTPHFVRSNNWHREGCTFETLTLTPSIQARGENCHWHGYISQGDVSVMP